MFELKTHVIRGARPGPNMLIVAGVHGDEFEPMAAVRQLIRTLSPQQVAGMVTLAPVVNESAFNAGRRVGDDGLDLARTCPGKADGTITEQAAHAVSQLIRENDYLIDLHTGGTIYTILPLVGYALVRDAQVLETQRRMARAFNLPVIWGTTPNLDGRTLSVARDAKVPAIYAEWGGGGIYNAQATDGYARSCLQVLAELGMLDLPPAPSIVEHFVEDNRELSGYFQINHPAPAEGCFEPCVTLGQRISKGDLLGVVSDVLGRERHEVRSQQGGVLLCLHSFSRVQKNEALATILEVA